MFKIFRILGKRGRITIPFEIRLRKRFAYNDVVSFEESGDDAVIIRREKICNHCTPKVEKNNLLEVIESLSLTEQEAIYNVLAEKYATAEVR